MAKWHINKNGQPAICHATVRSCPCGDAAHHFANRRAAESYLEKQTQTSMEGKSRTLGRRSKMIKPAIVHNSDHTQILGHDTRDSSTGCQIRIEAVQNGTDSSNGYSIKISSNSQGTYKGKFVSEIRTRGNDSPEVLLRKTNRFLAQQSAHPTMIPQTAVKKPVTVKAAQWNGDPNSIRSLQDAGLKWKSNEDGSITVLGALEGDLTYPKGSVIIQGAKGEFYGNKDPKDFMKRYDAKGDGSFVTKPSVIDNMEWTGDNLSEIQRFCPAASVDDDGELHVATSWGETLKCKRGDRVSCYDPEKNDFAVIDKDVFQATYEQMKS